MVFLKKLTILFPLVCGTHHSLLFCHYWTRFFLSFFLINPFSKFHNLKIFFLQNQTPEKANTPGIVTPFSPIGGSSTESPTLAGPGLLYCATSSKIAFSLLKVGQSLGDETPIEMVSQKLNQLREFIGQLGGERKRREEGEEEFCPERGDWLKVCLKVIQLVETGAIGPSDIIKGELVGICERALRVIVGEDSSLSSSSIRVPDLSLSCLDDVTQGLLKTVVGGLCSLLSERERKEESEEEEREWWEERRKELGEVMVNLGMIRMRLLLPSTLVDPNLKYTVRRERGEEIETRLREEGEGREEMERRGEGGGERVWRERERERKSVGEVVCLLRWKEIPRSFEGACSSISHRFFLSFFFFFFCFFKEFSQTNQIFFL